MRIYMLASMRVSRSIGYSININLHQKIPFTQTSNRNQLPNIWINNEKIKKKIEGVKRVRNPINVPSNINADIQQSINHLSNTKKIASLIEENVNMIQHASIFGKAMKKCNKLVANDWKSVNKIMKALLKSENKPTLIEFNIFFNSMTRSDSPELSVKYFDIMVNEYMIIPDVITFASLLKSFRKQGNTDYAEKYWFIMTDKYGIEPDEFVYSEMISVYSVTHQKEKAIKIFNQYLDKIKHKLLPCNMPTFGAYLNVFSRIGDIDGMKDAVEIMNHYGLELTEINVSDIMRGYYTAKKYDECINILDQWINNEKIPTMQMMLLKCVSLAHKIRESNECFKSKHALYVELRDTIYQQLEQYGLKINPLIALAQLDGAIFLYRFEDPMKIVTIFENMVEDKLMVYQQYDSKLKKYVIDLHHYQLWQAQFVIRYLIGFKLSTLLKSSKDGLWIIVEKGKHGEGDGNKQCKLKEFIVNELSSWNPPINCNIETMNEGTIFIDKAYLSMYLDNNDMNYAKQKLMVVSNDWYDDDPLLKQSFK